MKTPGEFRSRTIGVIRTPFKRSAGTPIQSVRAKGARGEVVTYKPFCAGLQDLDGFERVWLIYWLHKAGQAKMLVTPYLDDRQHGIFATRAPARPCPIGMSVVRLLGVRDGILEVADVDMLDATPLLDVKPYVPQFDAHLGSKAGWIDKSGSRRRLADNRFEAKSRGANRSRK